MSFLNSRFKQGTQLPSYTHLMAWILPVLFGLFVFLEVLLIHHFDAHVIKDSKNDFVEFIATTLGIGLLLLGLLSGFIYLLLRQTDRQLHAQQMVILESERRVKELAKQSRTIFWEVDKEGIFTYVSDEEESLTGYALQDVIGKMHFHDFYNKDKDQGYEERVRLVFEEHAPVVNQEDKLLAKDGSALWVLINAIPLLDAAGVFLGYRGILTDITTRKRAEEAQKEAMGRLQKIASRIPGVIYQYRLNPDGTSCFPFASAAIYSIYRVTPEQVRYDAQKVLNVLHPDDYEGVIASIMSSAQNLTPWRHEYRVKFDDGEVRWLFGNALPQKEEDGAILWHGFIDDITERKTMEKELLSLNEMLDKRVDTEIKARLKVEKEQEIQRQFLVQKSKLSSMGEMMGAIAHQWRQPLNVLSLNIQSLEDDFAEGLITKSFIKTFINKNRETILFMSKTIDDFRNFFKIDKAKQHFSVKEALMQTLSLHSAQFKNYHIGVEIEGEDVEIEGFKGEFQQVLLNILSNAKDAIVGKSIDEGHIAITLYPTHMVIEDNAGGIEETILERIFEPYFTTKGQGDGTGIGLYMSKMIIEKNMGGSLSVQNGTKGARFTIVYSR